MSSHEENVIEWERDLPHAAREGNASQEAKEPVIRDITRGAHPVPANKHVHRHEHEEAHVWRTHIRRRM